MSKTKMLKLKSSDGEVFEVEARAAIRSVMIKDLAAEHAGADTTIPLANVDSKTLATVIEWCEKHADQTATTADDLKKWDAEFVKRGEEELSDLREAARYLNILDLLILVIGKQIAELERRQRRKTPDEEERIRNEVDWARSGPCPRRRFCLICGWLSRVAPDRAKEIIDERGKHAHTSGCDRDIDHLHKCSVHD
ncbi:hypothetical protein L1049_011655 [Liquidambar formosana]|uniref:SKP1 component POZ domain-containing protein n=1 Tax=Liquidambar formosana TaxID=63359 RepID=A0AAP0RRR1_LIQFO